MADLLTLAMEHGREAGGSASTPVEQDVGEALAGTHQPALRDHAVAAGLLGLALLYATLRYNVFKHVPWSDWPGYTTNKALAVGSLLLLAAAVLRLARRQPSGILLLWSGGLALSHSLLSFALLSPLYFPKLFYEGKLTAAAGLSLLLGALLMAVMEIGARLGSEWPPAWRQGSLALVAFGTGLHASVTAFPSWVETGTWPGGLPPLTLISFVTGTVALIIWLRSRRVRASILQGQA